MPDQPPLPCATDLLTLRVEELERRTELHRTYQQESFTAHTAELRTRLESMNEFREQLRDQAKTFLTVDASEAKHLRLTDRTDVIMREMHAQSARHAEKDDAIAAQLERRIDDVLKFIDTDVRARIALLEIAKSNLEGRLWALGVLASLSGGGLGAGIAYLVKHV